MGKAMLVMALLITGCSSAPDNQNILRASRFLIDAKAPAISADVYVYDEKAPELWASQFLLNHQ